MDDHLRENQTVVSHKLCGAGNGGFFLTFSKKDTLKVPYHCVKIGVEPNGVSGKVL
jgi:mevalonate kinase